MKICQSLFVYVGNPLYKSDNGLEAGVWRMYWHSDYDRVMTLDGK